MKFLCLTDKQAKDAVAALPPPTEIAAAARRLALLGDPNRIRVALVLREVGELCVGDTANLLGLNIALVSHHVRALAANGLAEKRRDGKLVRYRLTPAAEELLAVALAQPAGRLAAAVD